MSNRLEASRKTMESDTPKWGKDDTPAKVMDEIVGLNERAARLYGQALEERREIEQLEGRIESLKREIKKRRFDAEMLFSEANENTFWACKITKMFLDHEKRRAGKS